MSSSFSCHCMNVPHDKCIGRTTMASLCRFVEIDILHDRSLSFSKSQISFTYHVSASVIVTDSFSSHSDRRTVIPSAPCPSFQCLLQLGVIVFAPYPNQPLHYPYLRFFHQTGEYRIHLKVHLRPQTLSALQVFPFPFFSRFPVDSSLIPRRTPISENLLPE